MLAAGMISAHIGSYVGENKLLESMVLEGRINLTLVPQGTLAERIRAGGAGHPRLLHSNGFLERWLRRARRSGNSMAVPISWKRH